jgi:hypothetical protein
MPFLPGKTCAVRKTPENWHTSRQTAGLVSTAPSEAPNEDRSSNPSLDQARATSAVFRRRVSCRRACRTTTDSVADSTARVQDCQAYFSKVDYICSRSSGCNPLLRWQLRRGKFFFSAERIRAAFGLRRRPNSLQRDAGAGICSPKIRNQTVKRAASGRGGCAACCAAGARGRPPSDLTKLAPAMVAYSSFASTRFQRIPNYVKALRALGLRINRNFPREIFFPSQARNPYSSMESIVVDKY